MNKNNIDYQKVIAIDLYRLDPIKNLCFLSNYITFRENSIRITGNVYGEKKLYVFFNKEILLLSFNFENLIYGINKNKNTKLVFKHSSISELLCNGLVNKPHTFFDNVFLLGIGDCLLIQRDIQKNWSLKTTINFPYFNVNNNQSSQPSTIKLKELITKSLSRRISSPDKAILMLSSGKDSSGLAIGLKNSHLSKVRCITFSTEDSNDEAEIASNIAKKLCLNHKIIKIDHDKNFIKNNFYKFFQEMNYPCVDNAMIPYMLCLAKADFDYDTIIDGMGNDIYFGHVPSKKAISKMILYRGIFKIINNILNKYIPRTSNLTYFGKYKSQLVVPGKYFKVSELNKFYLHSKLNDTEWETLDKNYQHLNVFDFRAITRGRFYDQTVAMMKAECVSGFKGARTEFPWCDEELVNYIFNLPQSYKFDEKKLKNKILLRSLLQEELNYENLQTKKVGFYLNSSKFALINEDYIKEEIFNCKLWTKDIVTLINKDFINLSISPKLSYSILAIFLLSGWYNHSKLFKKIQYTV